MNNKNLSSTYVKDLLKQKSRLQDALLYQGVKADDSDGLDALIDKVETLNSSKTYIKYLSFANCDMTQTTLDDIGININAFDPKYYKYMFRNIRSGYINLGKLDFTRIEDFENMFYAFFPYDKDFYIYLTPNMDFSNAVNMSSIFRSASTLYNDVVPKCSAKNLKYLRGPMGPERVFDYVIKKIYDAPLEDINNLFNRNVSPSTYPSELHIEMLEHLKNNNDLSNLKDIGSLFGGAYPNNEERFHKYLDFLYSLDTTKLTSIEGLFDDAINRGDTVGVTRQKLDFTGKTFEQLENVNNFLYSKTFNKVLLGKCTSKKLTSLRYMVNGSFTNGEGIDLEYLDMSEWDLSYVKDVNYFIRSKKELKHLYFGKNLGKSYEPTANKDIQTIILTDSKKLTVESLLFLFNSIYDLNKLYIEDLQLDKIYTQKISLGPENLAKLTPEQIAIATNKGWTVS